MAVEVDCWVCRRVCTAALRPSLRSVTPPVSESRDSDWTEFLNQSEIFSFFFLSFFLFLFFPPSQPGLEVSPAGHGIPLCSEAHGITSRYRRQRDDGAPHEAPPRRNDKKRHQHHLIRLPLTIFFGIVKINVKKIESYWEALSQTAIKRIITLAYCKWNSVRTVIISTTRESACHCLGFLISVGYLFH